MKYLSVCSGIEAASVAWHPLGWEPVAFSEIEKFPSAVLAHHYPTVPNLGDMTKFQEWPDEPVDLLVGGTPCQSFSVAGLRKGLEDPRGNLMLTYLAIAQRYRPRWVVWENVPGVLSSNGGRDFGTFLGALGELGYGWAYRVLDAQWFGVAQRRRRVFVVAHLGDAQRAAKVLFERESVQRNPAPSREAREGAAASVGGGPDGGRIAGAVTRKWSKGSGGPAGDECYNMVAQQVKCATGDITHALTTRSAAEEDGTGRGTPLVPTMFSIMPMNSGKDYKAREVQVAQPLMAGGPVGGSQGGDFVAQPIGFGAQMSKPKTDIDLMQTLQAKNPMAVAFHENQRGELTVNNTAGALKVGGGKPGQGYPAVAVAQPVAFTRCDNGQDAQVDVTPTMRCGSNYSAHLAVAQPVAFRDTADCLTAAYGTKWNGNASADNGSLFAAQPVYGTDCYNGAITGDVAATLGTPGSSVNASGPTVMQPVGIFQDSEFGVQQYGSAGTLLGRIPDHQMVMQPIGIDEEQNACVDGFGTLKARIEGGGFEGSVMTPAMQVRRLTPVECELTKGHSHAVAQPVAFEPGSIARNAGPAGESSLAPTLRSDMGDNQPAVRIAMQVRRLTPVECERLQGFPDGYTNIPWRKQPEAPDGPRYKALGNSMAVPCMAWIGKRIAEVDRGD